LRSEGEGGREECHRRSPSTKMENGGNKGGKQLALSMGGILRHGEVAHFIYTEVSQPQKGCASPSETSDRKSLTNLVIGGLRGGGGKRGD